MHSKRLTTYVCHVGTIFVKKPVATQNTCWQRNDTVGFTQASLVAHSTYNQAIQDYRVRIQEELQQHSTSKRWWSLTNYKSLTGSISCSRPMTPPAHQLAIYFSSKLSHPTNSSPIPTINNGHTSLLFQFQIKVSHVQRVLRYY